MEMDTYLRSRTEIKRSKQPPTVLVGPTRYLSNRPDSIRPTLELASLFNSNWDVDRDDRRSRGGSFFDGDVDSIYDEDSGHVAHGHVPGGRRWGEEALFWLERAVRRKSYLLGRNSQHRAKRLNNIVLVMFTSSL